MYNLFSVQKSRLFKIFNNNILNLDLAQVGHLYLFLDYIYAVTVFANKGHLQTTSIGFCGFLNPLFPKYITYAYLVSLSFR